MKSQRQTRRGLPLPHEIDPGCQPGPITRLCDIASYPAGAMLERHDQTFVGRNFGWVYWLDNILLGECHRLEAYVNGNWIPVRYLHDRDAHMEEVISREEREPGGRQPLVIPLPTNTLFRWTEKQFQRLRAAYARDEAKEKARAQRQTAQRATSKRGRRVN